MVYKSYYESPVGTIILTSDGTFLTGLWFDTSRFLELREVHEEELKEDLPIFKETDQWLDDYFASLHPDPALLSIKAEGTPFSLEVWEILKEIPYGQATTYGEIAVKLAHKHHKNKMSAQAVGHAVGHNPLSIIIPCHRVMGANHNLTGYGGGLDVKIALLAHEGMDISQFKRPKRGNAL